MIVAAQPEAAETGAEILRRGGNAIDAAIACAFSQGVVDPLMCGIGGFGSMQIFMPKGGIHAVLEFLARAPLAAKADMWADRFAGQTRDGFAFLLSDHANERGHLAAGTPGSIKGYADALARFGTMDLEDVMAPAIRQARTGFMIRPYVHYYWTIDQRATGQLNTQDKLSLSDAGRRLYFHPDGSLKRPGDIVVNVDLARTLERIASAGPDIFYTGEIAEEIAADMATAGGLITTKDLAAYRVREKEPIWGEYRGFRIAGNPPASGGASLIELLHILQEFDVSRLEHNSVEHIRILAEAMKWMTIDKDAHIGDPDFVNVPLDRLLSADHAAEYAARIRHGERAHVPRSAFGNEPPDTTVACVMDREGNAVTITHSLGSSSGAIAAGLGFMYNGVMSGFDPRPGRAASIAPGKARGSAMAPTIVFEGEAPMIAIGAPGGTFIVPAIAQALSNVIDFKMSMAEAVAAPRIVCLSDTIDVSNRVRHSVTDALEGMGYAVARSYQSYAFGAPHGVKVEGDGWSGGADPQRDGMAIGV